MMNWPNDENSLRFAVLIPAYEPDGRLLDLAAELRGGGMTVVVVNDGSRIGLEIFQQLEQRQVVVLAHPENLGKGCALKTGIAWLSEHGFAAVITADADGQHTAEDIRRIAAELPQHMGQLILGRRDLNQMPLKSRTGNSLTRHLFKLLYKIDLQDTQTGLRAFPLSLSLLEMPGDRYEYEMVMLIYAYRLFPGGIWEIPIQTVYLEENKASHFRPFKDGLKIYSVLLRCLPYFICTSALAFVLDVSLFNLLYYWLSLRTVAATALARLFSGLVNFLLNRRFVFPGEQNYTVWNYFKLALSILLLNAALMYVLVDICGWPAFAMKLLVECLLYLVSFTVQNRLASSLVKE